LRFMIQKYKDSIFAAYNEILHQQKFVEEELDYSILEKHKQLLSQLASIGNSGVSVFDLCKREHVFFSPHICMLLGYDMDELGNNGFDFFDSKIHADDIIQLTKNGISLLKLYFLFTSDEKANYKLINEYRMLNSSGIYIRVIEQHQLLELDAYGNVWLALSIIDISPNQEADSELKSQLLNFRTGKIIPFQEEDVSNKETVNISLTQREKQIIKMVKDGFLSKEISSKLSISVHTVNTHRQRVLEKLGANNSMEAIVFASKLGLL
jgi:DNA-binding CsgD family transcriptional regulator